MPLFKHIKKIKNFSVIFVPEDTSHQARSVKLSFSNLFWIGLVYTLIITVIGFYAISLSGLNNNLLPVNNGLNEVDRKKVEELNTKMNFLVRELEKLKATNERLKYSLILGDSTLYDSLSQTQDSVSQVIRIPVEGNILMAVQNLLFAFLQDDALPFIKPVNGYISRRFNPDKGHMGMDFVVKEGTPLYSTAGGYVVFSDYTVDDGYMIILNHTDGYLSVYKHCSSLIKGLRENVEQGELIAMSGNTGKNTSGPHLHFEIWRNGKPVDPEKLFINY
jgi:murein DD-endopeptidase MepM/ murein hydrolase activator NlpD